MKLQEISESKDKLTLEALPYKVGSLEPEMDKKTVDYHYHTLSKGYVDSSHMKLFFNYSIDREKAKTYTQNVKEVVENKFGTELQVETFESPQVGLVIKPKSSINKSKEEYSRDANKFMGLKRTKAENGISEDATE